MDAATVEELHAEYLAAKERNRVLTERYNREYRAGKWTTNRELAGKCEDAYSEEYRAMRAWEAARDAAEDDAAIAPAEDLQDAVTYFEIHRNDSGAEWLLSAANRMLASLVPA